MKRALDAIWTRDDIALSSFVADVGGDESSGKSKQDASAKDARTTDIFPPVSQAAVGPHGMAFSKYVANPGRDLRDLPNDLGIFTGTEKEGERICTLVHIPRPSGSGSRLSVHVMQLEIREDGNFTPPCPFATRR